MKQSDIDAIKAKRSAQNCDLKEARASRDAEYAEWERSHREGNPFYRQAKNDDIGDLVDGMASGRIQYKSDRR